MVPGLSNSSHPIFDITVGAFHLALMAFGGGRYGIEAGRKAAHLDTVFDTNAPVESSAEDVSYGALYQRLAVLYAAIFAISQTVASVPIKVQRTRKGSPIELPGHELEILLEKPSPFESGFDLSEGLTSYLELTGNGFWLAEDGEDFKPPTELHNLKPWRMSPIPSKDRLVEAWVHTVDGRSQTFSWEQVVVFKYFSPIHDILGQGSVEAASQAAVVDLYAQLFNKRFFQNGAQLHGVLTTPQQLVKDTADRIAIDFNSKHQGAGNAWRWRVLTHGLEAKPLTATHVEMAFPELRRMSREEILVATGVPPVMVGLLDGATYANAQEQRRSFWLNTILTKLRKQESTINRDLSPRYGADIRVFHDLTDVDALQEQVAAIVEQVTKLQLAGDLTANEARQWLTTRTMPQLDAITDDHGDTLYLPINLISTGEEETGVTPPPEPPEDVTTEEEGDDSESDSPAKRLRGLLPVALHRRKKPETNGDGNGDGDRDQVVNLLKSLEDQTRVLVAEEKGELIRVARWKGFESQRRQFDRMFRRTARRMFKAQEVAILAVIDEVIEGTKVHWVREEELLEDTVDSQDLPVETDDGLGWYARPSRIRPRKPKRGVTWPALITKADIGGATGLPGPVESILSQVLAAQKEFEATYATTIQAAGSQALESVGAGGVHEFSLVTAESVFFIETQGAQLVVGVNQTTKKALAKTLTEGLVNGDNALAMSDRVRGVMTNAKRHRANAIGRTESVKAFNFGTVEGYNQSGVVEEKEWLTARDSAVRTIPEDEFDHADHDGDLVPVDSPFTISGEALAYPGDPAGSAGNVINCRCTVLPKITVTADTP